MRTVSLLALLAVTTPAWGDGPEYPSPPPARGDEPLAPALSWQKAADYLDGVGVTWTREHQCITCHTNLPYLMARPLLDGDAGWREVRKFLEADLAKWEKAGKRRPPFGGRGTAVTTAAALAAADAHTTGKLSPATKLALERMWAFQEPTGEWNWPKRKRPPLEHDDYFGAALAAVAAGVAPEKYAESGDAKPGLDRLRAYLGKTPPPDLHHMAMLLWASARVPGLMTAAEQGQAVAELRKKQRADGGWCLPSLGTYTRVDGRPNDPGSPSDGYGTGFVVYVLRQAGVPRDDPAIQKGVAWLRASQRASGRWFTRSLNEDKEHYITNAGTAYAVMALKACEPPGK